jgi:hypothetical protein
MVSSSTRDRLRESHAKLEKRVATLMRQLSEALQQQATTADVLKIISDLARDEQGHRACLI